MDNNSKFEVLIAWSYYVNRARDTLARGLSVGRPT